MADIKTAANKVRGKLKGKFAKMHNKNLWNSDRNIELDLIFLQFAFWHSDMVFFLILYQLNIIWLNLVEWGNQAF